MAFGEGKSRESRVETIDTQIHLKERTQRRIQTIVDQEIDRRVEYRISSVILICV